VFCVGVGTGVKGSASVGLRVGVGLGVRASVEVSVGGGAYPT